MVCWPWISRWLRGLMARRTEDFLRRMAGMPTRKEEERARKRREKEKARRGADSSARRNSPDAGREVVNEMKEYAEDVEFTEVKQYSSEEIITKDETSGQTRIYKESQVSDAEYIEIK